MNGHREDAWPGAPEGGGSSHLPSEPHLVVRRADVERLMDDPRGYILDLAPMAMFAVDADLVVRFTGGGWLRLAGLSAADRIGRPLREVVFGGRNVLEHVTRALADGIPRRFDVPIGARVMQTVLRPVLVGDEPGRPVAGVVGFSVDVTLERDAARRAAAVAGLARWSPAGEDDPAALAGALAEMVAEYVAVAAAVRFVADGEPAVTGAAGGAWAGREHLAAVLDGMPVHVPGGQTTTSPPRAVRVALDDAPHGAPHEQGAASSRVALVWQVRTASGLLGTLAVLLRDGSGPELAVEEHHQLFVADLFVQAALRLDLARHRLADQGAERLERRRASHLEVLAACSRVAQESGSLGEADLRRILGRAAGTLGGGTCVAWIADGRVRSTTAVHADAAAEAACPGRCTAALDADLLGRLRDLSGPVVEQVELPGGADGAVCTVWVPMAVGGHLLGALGAHRRSPLDAEELAFLVDLADRLGLAEHNRRLGAERDAAAHDLVETQAQLRAAFEDAPVGMLLVSLDPADPGRCLLANRAVSALSGYSIEQLLRMTVGELTHPDDRTFDLRRVDEITVDGRGQSHRDKRLVRADGSHVWVRLSVSMFADPGRVAHAVLHVQDISAQKEAEAVSRAALASLQNALLPADVTAPPGISVASAYRTTGAHDRVGGDWYDTIELPGGGMALVVGDVEGHDVVAAAVMGLVRGAVRSSALDGHPPSLIVERVNAFLLTTGIERLVTLVYLELGPGHRLATVTVAGHPLPVVVPGDGGRARPLPVRSGLALGVEAGARWEEQTVLLPPSAAVVLYTDGLLDFPRAPDDQYERVLDLVTRHGTGSPRELADVLVGAGADYDDLAVLVARIPAGHHLPAARTFPAQPVTAGIVRTWIADLFRLWNSCQVLPADLAADDRLETVQLLVTELVSNAVRHSDETVGVRVDLVGQMLRVEILDTSDRMPVMRHPETDAVEGRGLRLVDALSHGWGVDLVARGKVVWFELDLASSRREADPETLLAAFDDGG